MLRSIEERNNTLRKMRKVPTLNIAGRTFAFTGQDELDDLNEALAKLVPCKEKHDGGRWSSIPDFEAKPQKLVATLAIAWEDE